MATTTTRALIADFDALPVYSKDDADKDDETSPVWSWRQDVAKGTRASDATVEVTDVLFSVFEKMNSPQTASDTPSPDHAFRETLMVMFAHASRRDLSIGSGVQGKGGQAHYYPASQRVPAHYALQPASQKQLLVIIRLEDKKSPTDKGQGPLVPIRVMEDGRLAFEVAYGVMEKSKPVADVKKFLSAAVQPFISPNSRTNGTTSFKVDEGENPHFVSLLNETRSLLTPEALENGQRRVDKLVPGGLLKYGLLTTPAPRDTSSTPEESARVPCAECGTIGAKKCCSRCKGTFYCERECQVKHWSTHKLSCVPVATSAGVNYFAVSLNEEDYSLALTLVPGSTTPKDMAIVSRAIKALTSDPKRVVPADGISIPEVPRAFVGGRVRCWRKADKKFVVKVSIGRDDRSLVIYDEKRRVVVRADVGSGTLTQKDFKAALALTPDMYGKYYTYAWIEVQDGGTKKKLCVEYGKVDDRDW